MRISDWGSDVCSSDLDMIVNAFDADAGKLLALHPCSAKLARLDDCEGGDGHADEQIQLSERGCALQEVVGRHVAEVRRIREARGHYGGGEFLDLGVPQPIELRPAKFGRADAGETGRGLDRKSTRLNSSH